METKRIATFYNNEWTAQKDKWAREMLREGNAQEPTEKEVNDWIFGMDENDYDDFIATFNRYCKNGKRFVITGSCGLWHGNYPIYRAKKTCYDWDDFRGNMFKDCDFFDFYEDENGDLHLEACHHDGRNHLVVKELTDKGAEYFENREYDIVDEYSDLEMTDFYKVIIEKYCQPIKLSEYC